MLLLPSLPCHVCIHIQADVTKSKGFAKDIRKGAKDKGDDGSGSGGSKKSGNGSEYAQVGSQGLGFNLGMEEYMKGSSSSSSSSSSEEEAEEQQPVEGA